MDADDIAVDDEVLCHGKHAVVRYVGEVEGQAGTWVGVEFCRAAIGKNDGEVDGVRYFGPTPPNHGLMVRAASLRKFCPEEAAATKLQAQVRRAQAAETVLWNKSFKAMNTLENRSESECLSNSFNTKSAEAVLNDEMRGTQGFDGTGTFGGFGTLGGLGATIGGFGAKPASIVTIAIPEEAEPPVLPQDDGLDESQDGVPRLEFIANEDGQMSVPKDCIDRVLRHFKTAGAAPLSPGCVAKLVHIGMAMLKREVQTAVKLIASPPPPGRVVVLGDTHGQLEDVLWLLFEHGEPSANNVYLLNGDVADRGSGACEIMILILLFKLWDPDCIHMNRGNHEDPIMNETYGFRDECTSKWGPQKGFELFNLFNMLFQHLPLASIVDNQVFVIHGGLWRRDFKVAQLQRVAFRRELPEKPGVGLDLVMFDSVWSDPQDGKGIGSNARGDAIVSFGPDVTKRFLKAHNFRLLVRSHQVPDSGSGYSWHHGGKCLTIFSASNYCGDCGNLGGVLILMRGETDQILEHWAPPLDELVFLEAEADRAQARLKQQAKNFFRQRAARRHARERMNAEIIRKVQELIVRRKADLFDYWADMDTSPRGVFSISPQQWREGCAAVLDDELPWVNLQETLGVVEDDGRVHYVKFLTRYRVAFDARFGLSASGWERAVWSKLMETLLMADLPLREALAALDSTSDGLVSGVEFARLIESCNVRITPLQARTLLRSFASAVRAEDQSEAQQTQATLRQSLCSTGRQIAPSRVSVWEMLERLSVSLPVASSAATAEENADAYQYLRPLASAVLEDAWRRLVPPGAPPAEWPVPKVLAAWFEDVDTSGSGFLEEDEFVTALRALAPSLAKCGCPTDIDTLTRLARCCDVTGNGHVNYFELLNGLTWEDSLGDDFKQDLLETLHAAIYFNIVPMRAALQKFDLELSGTISRDEFVRAATAVHTALVASGGAERCGIGRQDIEELAKHLPSKCGRIDYEAFLKSFRVVDTFLVSTPRAA